MKQILQNLKDGSTEIAEVPCPRLAPGHLLLRTTRTLISAGTERMLVDFGKANPLEKARQQPDKVRQVLEKVKTDGLAPTLAAVRNKLEQPLPLGYCQVGVVAAVGGGRQTAAASEPTSSAPLSPDPSPARGEGSKAVAPLLMVGFNRRFAPQVVKIKELLAGVTGPKALVMTVNAGAIPADHWTQDPAVGGGRIIGEACHFIDLLRFLAGVRIVRAEALALDAATRDSVSISLGFADGSLGTILYLANGSKAFPKERLEVFAAGRVLQLDNFRKLTGFGWPGFKKLNLWRQDKGQQACAAAFVQALRARVAGEAVAPPIPLEEILEVSRVTIEVAAVVAALRQ